MIKTNIPRQLQLSAILIDRILYVFHKLFVKIGWRKEKFVITKDGKSELRHLLKHKSKNELINMIIKSVKTVD